MRLLGLSVLFAVTTLGLPACGDAKRPDGGSGLLPIAARDLAHKEVRLSTLRGRPVVVYFYPADGTPGCTKEACAFRDAWKRFETSNVGIIGVSSNSADSHEKFQKEHQIPFPLASDDDGAIGAAYGVKKHIWGYDRVSFLVDKDGKVAHVWPSVDPGVHADEVLAEATKSP